MAEKKHLFLYFTLSVIFYIAAFAIPTVIFVWSCFQISNHVTTTNGTTITNGGTVYEKPCLEIESLKKYRPSRFTYNADPSPLGCGWSDVSLAARMCISAAAAIVAIISFIVTFVKRSKATYIFTIVLGAGAVGYFWLLIQDSKLVAASAKWCAAGLDGIPFGVKPSLIDCSYWPFIGICILDGFAFLSWVLLSWTSTMYMCIAGPRKSGQKDLAIETGHENFVSASSSTTSENAFVPNNSSENPSSTTPLVSHNRVPEERATSPTNNSSFNFESRAKKGSSSPPPPQTQATEQPTNQTNQQQQQTTTKGSAPPPSSGAFNFEEMSKKGNTADLPF